MINEYCIVLGANGGIGLEISKYLIDKGYKLILHYNTNSQHIDEIIKTKEQDHIKIKFDITDSDSIKNALKEIGAGKDIEISKCINCVGIHYRSFIPLMSDNKFRNVVETNLTGAFLIIKHISAGMIKNKRGTIVNISSVAGINGLIGQACYSSSKAGLDAITKIASKELAKYNIRVNSIAPGFIEAGIIENPTENDLEYLEKIPMRRFGKAQEVAKLSYALSLKIVPIISYYDYNMEPKWKIYTPIIPLKKNSVEDYCQETMQKIYKILEKEVCKHLTQWEGWLSIHKILIDKIEIEEFEHHLVSETSYKISDSVGFFRLDNKCFLINKLTYKVFEISNTLYLILKKLNNKNHLKNSNIDKYDLQVLYKEQILLVV